MGVASWLLILLGLLNGSGPAGGLPLRKGWAADRRALVCGVVGLSGAGIGDTPAVVGCCGCCGCGGLLVVGAPACLVRVGVACCRGSGAVRPGCLARVLLSCVGGGAGCGWVGCELYSGREHLTVRFLRQSVSCFVRVSLLFVFLSVRWMPWHQGPMKDVVACDIPRGAGWRAVIRGFPNGGTRHELCRVTCI